MKRKDLLQHLRLHGSELLREGSRHSWWHNPKLISDQRFQRSSGCQRHEFINHRNGARQDSCVHGHLGGLQEAAANALREGKAFVNLSKIYAEAVGRSATPSALEGIAETHLSHPTDSHPTLAVRLNSLETSISSVSTGALDVTPSEPAIALIPDPEKTEETISKTYQLILARRLGIGLSAGSQAEQAGA